MDYVAQYVLHPDVSEHHVVTVVEAMGGSVAGRLEAARGDPLDEVILQIDDPVHEVRFVDDAYVEVAYVVVASQRHPAHLRLIAALQRQFSLYSLLDLRELMRSGDEGGRILALRGYGAILDGFWGAIPKDYAEALTDPRRSVREAVLAGMARIAWVEFIPLLEAAIPHEADAMLAEDMRTLVDGLRLRGKRGIDQMF